MASELYEITLRGAKPGDRVRLGELDCTVVSRDSESGKLELRSDEGVSMTYLPVRRALDKAPEAALRVLT